MTLQPFTPHTPYSPPLCRLEHRATSVLLRDLLADPAVVSEMRADPYISAQFHDLLDPTPPTHATTSTLPSDHAAMPAAVASPSSVPSSVEAHADAHAASATAETHTALPLRHRIYALYCEGHSISAIARDLALDRGTVTRHLRAVEAELAADHTADLARLRLRAVEAHYAILAAAWESLAREELRESSELAAAAVAREHGDRPPAPYRAQRARLLGVAAQAARTAAQLQGLLAHPAPITLPADLPNDPAASCGMPASDPAPVAAPALEACLPVACDSADSPLTTPPASAESPRACDSRAGSLTTPASFTELPRACDSRAGKSTSPFAAAATTAVRAAIRL